MGKSNHFRKTSFSRPSGILVLLAPLIFHLAWGSAFSNSNFDRNGNGLLRSLVKGIFYPVNHTNPFQTPKINRDQEVVISGRNQNQNGDDGLKAKPLEEVTTTVQMENSEEEEQDEGSIHVDIEIDKSLIPQLPDLVEEEVFDPETNKTKRSKAQIRRLLQKLGILRAPTTKETEAVNEFESQMDEGSESADDSPTTPGSSILSKLNPINKIRYKINAARNVVNRALNVVGIGGGEKKDGGQAEGEGESEGEAGNPRDVGTSMDESSSSSSNSIFYGVENHGKITICLGLIVGSLEFILQV